MYAIRSYYAKFPALIGQARIDEVDADMSVQPLESQCNERAACPGADVGQVKVVATGIRRKAVRLVGADAVAKTRGLANEASFLIV